MVRNKMLINNEDLIKAVEKYPQLYDRRLKSFRNKKVKNDIWNRVSNLIGASPKSCATRWRSLKDQYTRQKAKIRNGTSAENLKPWYFTSLMSFLDQVNFSKINEGNSNFGSLQTSSDHIFIETGPNASFSESTPSSHPTSFQPFIINLPTVAHHEESSLSDSQDFDISENVKSEGITIIDSFEISNDDCDISENDGESECIPNLDSFEESEFNSNIASTNLSFLPENYEYKLIRYEQKEGNNFTASFKIKNIKAKEQSMEWLRDYQEKSKETWRVARTFKAAGKYILHRRDYRCQHNTDNRCKPQRGNREKSKNTDCPAILKIIIKRYFKDSKFKKTNPDKETKEYPCFVELYSWHNHSLDSGLALRHRDMSKSTKEKLLHYYHEGHTASSALHALKTDLLLQNPDEYVTMSADNSIIPTSSVIQHLFNKEFSRTYAGTCSSRWRSLRDKSTKQSESGTKYLKSEPNTSLSFLDQVNYETTEGNFSNLQSLDASSNHIAKTVLSESSHSYSEDFDVLENDKESECITNNDSFEESELSSNNDPAPRCVENSHPETPVSSRTNRRRIPNAINEIEKFGSFISSQLKTFNEKDKLEAYKRISDILFEIKSRYC